MEKAKSSTERSPTSSPHKRTKNGEAEPIYLTEIRDRINQILNGTKEFKKPLIAVVVKAALNRHGVNTEELRLRMRERMEHMLKSRRVVFTDMQGTPIGTKRPASKKHKAAAVQRPRRGAEALNEESVLRRMSFATEPTEAPAGSHEKILMIAARYALAKREQQSIPLTLPRDSQVQSVQGMSDEEELAVRMKQAADLNAVRVKYVPREATLSERLAARFNEPSSLQRYRR